MPRRGFTLLELLVAVGIIAVLLSLLLPTLAAAREASKATRCLANLRQLATAAHDYAAAHDGSYPLAQWYAGGNPPGSVAYAWDFTVARNLSTGAVTVQPGLLWLGQAGGGKGAAGQVQQCPSFEGSSTTVADPYTGYNYNTSRIGRGLGETIQAPARVGEISHPARCALFGDGQWQAGANKFMRSPFPTPADAAVQARSAGTQGYRHRGRTNVVFCDGHAEAWASRFTRTSDATRPADGTGFLSPDNSLYTGE